MCPPDRPPPPNYFSVRVKLRPDAPPVQLDEDLAGPASRLVWRRNSQSGQYFRLVSTIGGHEPERMQLRLARQSLAAWVLGAGPGTKVRHANGDYSDARRANLRIPAHRARSSKASRRANPINVNTFGTIVERVSTDATRYQVYGRIKGRIHCAGTWHCLEWAEWARRALAGVAAAVYEQGLNRQQARAAVDRAIGRVRSRHKRTKPTPITPEAPDQK